MTNINRIIFGLGGATNARLALNANHWFGVIMSDDIISDLPRSRKEAKSLGSKHFYTGYPCWKNHNSKRQVSNGACCECASEYAKNNLDLFRKRASKYRKENPDKTNRYIKKYRDKFMDRVILKNKEYREKNRLELNEKAKLKARKDYKNDYPRILSYRHKRRAKIKDSGGQFNSQDIKRIFSAQNGRCANAVCRKRLKKYHADHIMPIFLGGSNWAKNIQLLCPTCNHKKSKKHPNDWARENGLLI